MGMRLFDSSAGRVAAALAASALVHGGLAALMSRIRTYRAEQPAQTTLQVAVVDAPRPVEKPAEKPPEPPVPKPPPAPVKIARAPKLKTPPPMVQPKTAQPPPPANVPPPPSVEAKQPSSAPVETGVTMESTSQGGSWSVGVGNTLYGTPSTRAKDPGSVKPYKAEKYASIATVTEMPTLRERPDLRSYYPEQARQKDFEGDVTVRVLIDSDGTVVKADIVNDPGEGLGPAAVKAVLGKRLFNPARQNGVAVATSTNVVLNFQLR